MISIFESVSRKTAAQLRYDQEQNLKQNAMIAGLTAAGLGGMYTMYRINSRPQSSQNHSSEISDRSGDSILSPSSDDSIFSTSSNNDSILEPQTDDSIFSTSSNNDSILSPSTSDSIF